MSAWGVGGTQRRLNLLLPRRFPSTARLRVGERWKEGRMRSERRKWYSPCDELPLTLEVVVLKLISLGVGNILKFDGD